MCVCGWFTRTLSILQAIMPVSACTCCWATSCASRSFITTSLEARSVASCARQNTPTAQVPLRKESSPNLWVLLKGERGKGQWRREGKGREAAACTTGWPLTRYLGRNALHLPAHPCHLLLHHVTGCKHLHPGGQLLEAGVVGPQQLHEHRSVKLFAPANKPQVGCGDEGEAVVVVGWWLGVGECEVTSVIVVWVGRVDRSMGVAVHISLVFWFWEHIIHRRGPTPSWHHAQNSRRGKR
jgi:hypothetical protein